MALILDTSFVIQVEREGRRPELQRAARFLQDHLNEQLYITFTVMGELACGRSLVDADSWRRLCGRYDVLGWRQAIGWQYGVIYRHLSASGSLIGTNDLWIAATALVHGMPVVTANVNEFARVPGLTILTF